jgi:hypothetical protein
MQEDKGQDRLQSLGLTRAGLAHRSVGANHRFVGWFLDRWRGLLPRRDWYWRFLVAAQVDHVVITV